MADQTQTSPDPVLEHTDDVHTWFGLTYANYLVLPRTLLQSMPLAWQARFVALLRELGRAFEHVPQAEAYEVIAGGEHIPGEMTAAELAAAGITLDEGPCEGDHDHDENEGANCWPSRSYYHSTRDGRELGEHERVIVPAPDPVPHYNRGRSYVAPRLGEPVA